MPRISPFLRFDSQAEAAARFYVGVFPNSRIVMKKIDIATLGKAYDGEA